MIRDLVVDIGDFMRKLPTVKPWIVREEEKPLDEGEYLQTPAEMDEYKQFSMCINCMLCYSACPVYALDPEFVGPAAIALAQRYNLDSRDEGAEERLRPAHHTPKGSGHAPSSASAPRPAPRVSTRPARSSATSSPPRRTRSSPCSCPGGHDDCDDADRR